MARETAPASVATADMCCASSNGSPRVHVPQDQKKVCPLAWGVMSQPLSVP